METKKLLSNFLSKLVESDFALNWSSLCYTGSRVLLAVVFLFLLSAPVLAADEAAAARVYKLQQRLIDNPRDIEAHLQLAMEYSLANNFVKAVETYFVLLRIDPDNFHAYKIWAFYTAKVVSFVTAFTATSRQLESILILTGCLITWVCVMKPWGACRKRAKAMDVPFH